MAPFTTSRGAGSRGAGSRGARGLSRSAPVPIPDSVFKIPNTVLDNLLFRFIHNMPEHEKSHELTLMQAAEKAHWYYSDFHCTDEFDGQNDARWRAYPDCKRVKFEPFLQQLFNRCVFGDCLKSRVHELAKGYSLHKQGVPAYGLILFDASLDYILLVCGYTGKWSFPKGKVNDNEIPIQCAIREVREEIGYDATDNVKKSRQFVTSYRHHTSQCFVALNVPMDYPFKPRVRKEIEKIAWFSLDDLPSAMDQNEKCRRIDPAFTCQNFVQVIPRINEIRAYTEKRKKKAELEPKMRILQRGFEKLNVRTESGEEGEKEPAKKEDAPKSPKPQDDGGEEPAKKMDAPKSPKPQYDGGEEPAEKEGAPKSPKPQDDGGEEPAKKMERDSPKTPRPLMVQMYVDPFPLKKPT